MFQNFYEYWILRIKKIINLKGSEFGFTIRWIGVERVNKEIIHMLNAKDGYIFE